MNNASTNWKKIAFVTTKFISYEFQRKSKVILVGVIWPTSRQSQMQKYGMITLEILARGLP